MGQIEEKDKHTMLYLLIILYITSAFIFFKPILDATAEILQKFSVPFWAMEVQEKLLLRFPDL